MTHLDDGQLHAYLDGERGGGRTAEREHADRHLVECAACRARLEKERSVRDRARAILGAAGPGSPSPPPFEAVLERAARRQASRRRFPTVALAWAASLALAVTVGWYARGLVRGEGAGEGAVATGTLGTADTGVRGAGIEAVPPADRQLAQGAPARADVGQPAREGAGAVTPTTAAPAPAPAPAAPIANLAAAEAKAAADTEVAPPRAEESAARRMAEAAPPAPAPAAAINAPIRTRVAVPTLAEQTWLAVRPAEAEERLGGPLALIPGLPSLGTSVFGTGPSTVARTIQVLGPGLTIELVQQRVISGAIDRAPRERVAAPAAMPQAGRAPGDQPGRSLTVEWEGFSVTGRALVPPDSLQKLLGRLRRP